ncbi:MAG: glycosyltransferase family 9 protein [Proteobacteria bacterium]|nr:glycosyltransferase family 9 protein [Pseudomonadota bacterium]
MTIHLDGKKVLIIKLRYIGDTLSLLPVIENLRKKARNTTVDIMVNKGTEEVMAPHPGIRRLWVYDRRRAKRNAVSSLRYHGTLIRQLRSEKYDAVIDFTHGDRAAFIAFMTGAPHRITYQNASTLSHLLMNHIIRSDPLKHHIVDQQLLSLRLFGLDDLDRTLRLHIPQSFLGRAAELIAGAGIPEETLKVVVHPGSRGRLRQWRPERFAEVARRLVQSTPATIMLIGGPEEGALVEEVERNMGFPASLKSCGLSLLEMAALLSRCQLFLGNDSAPGHIAAAVGCPSVTLFGPTFPHLWRPLSAVGEVLFKNVPCCGCRQEACIRPDSHCMDLIEVDEVWGVIRKLLVIP